MEKWTRPQHYVGASWPGYYVFLSQTRDSGALTRSNFKVALARLGGESGTDECTEEGYSLVEVVRESHWAVGWIEWIAIHESATEKVKLAEEMEASLDYYPVLDEESFSETEYEDCAQTWKNCFDVPERLAYFRMHGYCATSLSDLLQAIRGGSWYHAANMLNCPSDLLY
jgi:hypothetical protein